MKPPVIGPGSRVQDVRRNRASDRASGCRFAAHLQTDAATDPPAVTASAELVGLDAILALQGSGDDAAQDRRNALRQHGESILDQLDGLRSDLLLGRISRTNLIALAQHLRTRPLLTGDARLDTVLGEIELRAEVELAKLAQTEGATVDPLPASND